MAIKAIVFDIGGVLEINTPMAVVEKLEGQLGLSCGEYYKRLGHVIEAGRIGTITELEFRQQVSMILKLDQECVNNFMADMWAEYLGALNIQLARYFASLHSNYMTGIISNSFVGAREREEELYGFQQMTDMIIYSHEVGISKPNRQIYELACKHLDIQPKEMIFLDDFQPNVEAARDIGIHAVLFSNTTQAIEEIEEILQEYSR